MAQRQRQRAVAAHRMPADAQTCGIDAEVRVQQHRQFAHHQAFHAEAAGIRRLRGVQPEAGAFAEFPIAGGTFNTGVARAGIRRHQRQAELGRHALRAGLDGEGFLGAGEAGQEQQRRHASGAFGPEHAETHRAAAGVRLEPVEALHAAKAALFGQHLQRRHCHQ